MIAKNRIAFATASFDALCRSVVVKSKTSFTKSKNQKCKQITLEFNNSLCTLLSRFGLLRFSVSYLLSKA